MSERVPAALESRSRLVSAPTNLAGSDDELPELSETLQPDALVSPAASGPSIALRSDRDDVELEVGGSEEIDTGDFPPDDVDALRALEDIEPAPASSRRPIALAEPEVEPEADSAPRHTPPPESGRQKAAPSVDARKSAHEVTGVRRASAPSLPVEVAPTPEHPTLVPDVTRVGLSANSAVASFLEVDRAPEAATFADLLDQSLML